MALPVLAVGASALLGGLTAVITSGVSYALASFFSTAVTALGIGLISYAAIDPLINGIVSQAFGYLNFPSDVAVWVGVLQLDKIMTVWTSALTVKISLTAMTKIAVKRK